MSTFAEKEQASKQVYDTYNQQIQAYIEQINNLGPITHNPRFEDIERAEDIFCKLDDLRETIDALDTYWTGQLFFYMKRELLETIEKWISYLIDYMDPPDERTLMYRKQIQECDNNTSYDNLSLSNSCHSMSDLRKTIEHDDQLIPRRKDQLLQTITNHIKEYGCLLGELSDAKAIAEEERLNRFYDLRESGWEPGWAWEENF